MKNIILMMISGLRRHWVKIAVIIVVGYIFLGFPPGIPSTADIEIETDKVYYAEGERINTTFYLANRSPWPIRMEPYYTAEIYVTYDGEPVGAGNAVHLDWGEARSIYISPMQEQEILESYSFKVDEAGVYSIVVELYGHEILIARAERHLTVQKSITELSDVEKEVVDEALRIALVEKKIPDYNLLVKNTPIILSSENIGNYEPEIESVNIVVMTPQEIVDKAEDTGNFLHLKFKKISASGSSGIIELDNTWVSGVYDGVGYTSGGGFTLYIYKLDDGWGYEITSGWIS